MTTVLFPINFLFLIVPSFEISTRLSLTHFIRCQILLFVKYIVQQKLIINYQPLIWCKHFQSCSVFTVECAETRCNFRFYRPSCEFENNSNCIIVVKYLLKFLIFILFYNFSANYVDAISLSSQDIEYFKYLSKITIIEL